MGKRNRTGRILEIRNQIIAETKLQLILIAEILENFEFYTSQFCYEFNEDIRNWPPIVERRKIILHLKKRLNYFHAQGWKIDDLISKDYKKIRSNLFAILYNWLPEFLEREVTEFIIRPNRIPSMIPTAFGDRKIDDEEMRISLANLCREMADLR
ncbi:MAG TPA: hypothetical protein PK677_16420 [Acidiphilium sp.]|uniref:hypothetical protein n=1 Tax=unclassified Acidiphilium TaxID=2617493 RepID=UPI00258116AC|nr:MULTISPECIES: hypothetical protein [unclassified Acidiphilium]HQT90095.1 hypothetical protein [Acidiphilium sp.]